MTSNSDNPDHVLAALRYFNNEMSPVEIANYEALLAVDCAAQDALAEVVLIQQSLESMARSNVAVLNSHERVADDREVVPIDASRQHSHSKHSGRLALAFSAAAIAMIGYVVVHVSSTSQLPLTSMTDVIKRSPIEHQRQDVSVVTMWSFMSGDEAPALGVVASDQHESAWESDEISSSLSTEDLIVPDWMFAAVEASRLEDDLPEMNEFDDEETL